ncbi:hypothetical protein B0H14DRAFT_3853568 [Mycena olivaceomarginata]|nr:hypothetical protein B0H14DRAFT_3853568 [Mycena olivaceomarginata]
MSVELPPELWNRVFELLPRRSLLILRTVSSLFSALSSPCLYKEFKTWPSIYSTQGGTSSPMRRELVRLAFWSSDKVAPHVRTCHVRYTGDVVLQGTSTFVNALFDTISHFSNLRSLSCTFNGYRIELPALRVENLLHLQKLQIHGGPLSRPDEQPTSLKISVRHFGYTDIFIPYPGDGPPRFSCLSLLDPDALRSLELGAGHPLGLAHFLADKPTMASFHNLRALSITFAESDFNHIHASISSFPAVEDLILDLRQPCTPGPDSDSASLSTLTPLAPHLRRYKGPVALLPLILRGSHPTHLTLTQRGGSATELLQTLLRPRCDTKSVSSLAIRVALHADICADPALLELLALFPRLTRLAIHVSSDRTGALESSEPHTTSHEHISDRLAHILTVPPALQTAVFRWRLARTQDAEILPSVAQLTARTHVINPRLEVSFSRLSADLWGF